MDSLIDLISQSGLSMVSYGAAYGLFTENKNNKFTKYSMLSGFSLTAVGFSLLATKSACRFLKAG